MDELIRNAARDAKIGSFGAMPAVNWAQQGVAGVAYLSSTSGSQTYNASALVKR